MHLLFACLTLHLTCTLVLGQLLNPDQDAAKNVKISGKTSVSLSTIHNKDELVDSSWPPSQEFANVDVVVMGKTINSAEHNMEPDVAKMKPKKLKKILDDNYDPVWVSAEKPKVASGIHAPEFSVDPKLTAQIDKLNFSTTDAFGKQVKFDLKTLYHFKTWLMQQASCPMEYFWEDLGPLFWPRWIKRGHCRDTHCSWPPGMRCRHSGQKQLKMLRWVCSSKNKVDDINDPRFRKRNVRRRKNRRKERRNAKKRKAWRSGKKKKKKRRSGKKEKLEKEGWEKRGKGRRERRRRRLIMRFSETIGDYFCYWKQIDYYVTDSCACMCR